MKAILQQMVDKMSVAEKEELVSELKAAIAVELAAGAAGEPAECPRCGCPRFTRKGRGADGAQRWLCAGCGYCHMACPYNAPKVDHAVGHSVKCDGCADRVAQGKEPICVGACPLRALEFGTADEMAAKGKRAAIAPLPEPSYTNPNLYILENDDAVAAGMNTGVVANTLEVM